MAQVASARGLWGYAETDHTTVVGIVVAIVVAAALGYVTRRWWLRRRGRR